MPTPVDCDTFHVSTHASVRRRHPGACNGAFRKGVSTHASVRRRQGFHAFADLGHRRFNSRLREEATSGESSSFGARCVSTHASVRRRQRRTAGKRVGGTFQLTPP